MNSNDMIEVEITAIINEARDINSYELRPVAGGVLPAFTAGAHIDLHLSNGLVRSYSLSNNQDERDRYVVSIAKDVASRGGSSFIHETFAVGQKLMIGPLRNHFPLNESAPHTLLIAGGIGITPMWCMAQRLESLGRSWELIYCARTQPQAAFLEVLRNLQPRSGKVRFNFDGEPGGSILDIAAVVNEAAPGTHFYCCGPTPMIEAFERATDNYPAEQVHVEYFSAKEAPAANEEYTVVLAKSGKDFAIAPGMTILDALLDNNINVSYSCMEGTCGECVVRVISGTPDHRDVFLSKADHAANDKMTVCCSGSKCDRLVIDL
ncbi:PDR/VanB family oxidoreductase [Burkholderia sp. WSM2230]|uniref:PDR/VanB family oxidoreductase n=1 Tax=Burkholderia sp. WSM2230 TaxID=944435 RepID=UPI000471E726|nr:PDR/VanB family oxidoreductase [Burkholderia sp. WSM2230]